jgi:hypothetical protein
MPMTAWQWLETLGGIVAIGAILWGLGYWSHGPTAPASSPRLPSPVLWLCGDPRARRGVDPQWAFVQVAGILFACLVSLTRIAAGVRPSQWIAYGILFACFVGWGVLRQRARERANQ